MNKHIQKINKLKEDLKLKSHFMQINIALNSSQNQLSHKQCWCKDTMAWLNQWGINETTF